MIRTSIPLVGTVLLLAACQPQEEAPPSAATTPAPLDTVILETSRGRVVIELIRERAPVSVANFERHVKAGFYDGLIFHRIAPNFVIQAGRVMENRAERTSQAPPITNEADNGLQNLRGTVAMARQDYPHSATSEFFINLKDNAKLDFREATYEGFGYAVFGRVIEGLDVVDAIAATKPVRRGMYAEYPTDPTVIRRAFLQGTDAPGP
ncbi:MAG: peptidylprolyl isomerase [Gemmatimonadota bacterium]|nr:peptidylprolyl isomerase [Gemmatimonadota bacterium]MDH4349694.1 peptidylprolyl isomerase [Gemmatimonadota bacterium]MDH5196871.1 peptidylprolyl isomerase [Gemmatimonadota bacterium]